LRSRDEIEKLDGSRPEILMLEVLLDIRGMIQAMIKEKKKKKE